MFKIQKNEKRFSNLGCGQLDIAIVIDVSSGIGTADNWIAMKSFVKNTLSHLASNQFRWRASLGLASVIAYSRTATLIGQTNDVTYDWLENTVAALRMSASGDRNVSGALEVAASLVSSSCVLTLMQIA